MLKLKPSDLESKREVVNLILNPHQNGLSLLEFIDEKVPEIEEKFYDEISLYTYKKLPPTLKSAEVETSVLKMKNHLSVKHYLNTISCRSVFIDDDEKLSQEIYNDLGAVHTFTLRYYAYSPKSMLFDLNKTSVQHLKIGTFFEGGEYDADTINYFANLFRFKGRYPKIVIKGDNGLRFLSLDHDFVGVLPDKLSKLEYIAHYGRAPLVHENENLFLTTRVVKIQPGLLNQRKKPFCLRDSKIEALTILRKYSIPDKNNQLDIRGGNLQHLSISIMWFWHYKIDKQLMSMNWSTQPSIYILVYGRKNRLCEYIISDVKSAVSLIDNIKRDKYFKKKINEIYQQRDEDFFKRTKYKEFHSKNPCLLNFFDGDTIENVYKNVVYADPSNPVTICLKESIDFMKYLPLVTTKSSASLSRQTRMIKFNSLNRDAKTSSIPQRRAHLQNEYQDDIEYSIYSGIKSINLYLGNKNVDIRYQHFIRPLEHKQSAIQPRDYRARVFNTIRYENGMVIPEWKDLGDYKRISENHPRFRKHLTQYPRDWSLYEAKPLLKLTAGSEQILPMFHASDRLVRFTSITGVELSYHSNKQAYVIQVPSSQIVRLDYCFATGLKPNWSNHNPYLPLHPLAKPFSRYNMPDTDAAIKDEIRAFVKRINLIDTLIHQAARPKKLIYLCDILERETVQDIEKHNAISDYCCNVVQGKNASLVDKSENYGLFEIILLTAFGACAQKSILYKALCDSFIKQYTILRSNDGHMGCEKAYDNHCLHVIELGGGVPRKRYHFGIFKDDHSGFDEKMRQVQHSSSVYQFYQRRPYRQHQSNQSIVNKIKKQIRRVHYPGYGFKRISKEYFQLNI